MLLTDAKDGVQELEKGVLPLVLKESADWRALITALLEGKRIVADIRIEDKEPKEITK